MKTNLYNKLILAVGTCFFMVACNESSFLDTKDPNRLTEEDAWNTETQAFQALATVYSPVRAQMYGYFGAFTGFQNMNVRGDDVFALYDDEQTWDITVFQNTMSTDRYDFGSMYKCIHRANTFLENVDRVDMDEARKSEMKGEVYFLRGFNYFLLATNYEQAPLRISTVKTTEDAMVPSVSEERLWQQAEEDFKEAKERLPITRSADQNGRVTKGAAIAYLGKCYVFQEKYAEGKQELEIIMNAPYIYDLVADYEDNFTPMNEFNEESIFEINYAEFGTGGGWGDEEATSRQGMVLSQFVGTGASGGWFKLMPSAFIIDEFTIEERPAGSDSRFDKRMYTNFFFKYSDYGDVKEDERWYANAFDMDDLWNSTEGHRISRGQPELPIIDGVPGRFLPKKFTAFWSDLENGDSMYNTEQNDNNYRVMRFAEVLLLHAEAAAKTGDVSSANNDLKRIRERAGLAEKTFSTESEIMTEIEHQRLLEFWFEGHRFFDLKRWYNYSAMRDIFVRNQKQGAANFQEKHYVFPIPEKEMNTNTEIEQHPLWR